MKQVRVFAIAALAASMVGLALAPVAVEAGWSGKTKKRAGKSHAAPVHFGKASMAADEAFALLTKGNQRFVASGGEHPHQDEARRLEVSKGQKPHTVVLTCADSRLSPEIIFDQGLGDLFVVRVAGNTINPELMGSIEYALEHLGSRLVIVMGHESCGAVAAAIQGGTLHHHLPHVVAPIKPAVSATQKMTGDRLSNTVQENVRMTVRRIKRDSQVVAQGMLYHDVKVVGAYYDLDQGKVHWLK